ncbi:MAG: GDP-mannose 4,6-dehydratase [Nitrososphaerota archaeon]|nr:GDP-mannose 4,6-dehydratase [Nitrososphaerota archaeon]
MDIKDQRILVTGGLGFIGSHLVEKLLDYGCSVTAYDKYDDFYPGKEENAKILLQNKEFKIIHGDILDESLLKSAVKNSDLIFHLAAQAGVRYCNQLPLKANKVNVIGTLNVLLAAKEAGVKKIVYASSSSIYGDPVYLPMDEKHPTNPNSPYGVSKLAGEQYCKVFTKVYGMNISSLRYFSVYGPRGRPDQVIYAFADKIRKGEQPVIFGDGEQTRDFTYISDVVDGTVLAMEKDTPGEAYNIGHGSRITMNELLKKVCSHMGKSVQALYTEKAKGDFPDTEANHDKAKNLLGWNPKVTLDEGLKQFFEWFKF